MVLDLGMAWPACWDYDITTVVALRSSSADLNFVSYVLFGLDNFAVEMDY
jgi:hypothetical protein